MGEEWRDVLYIFIGGELIDSLFFVTFMRIYWEILRCGQTAIRLL